MHDAASKDETEKKKPLVIHFYNENKGEVDVFDLMARKYTAHISRRRWPLAVWTNILDIAALNSCIVYKKASGQKITRHNFILQLIVGLRKAYAAQKVTQENTVEQASVQRPSGKRLKCADKKRNNNTVSICQHCRKPTGGKCDNYDWKFTDCKKFLLPQD